MTCSPARIATGPGRRSSPARAAARTCSWARCSRSEVVVGDRALLAASSLVAGAALVGAASGRQPQRRADLGRRMLALTLVSWAYCLLPVFAYTSVAILISVATRNGILGVLGPLILALVTQLLDLIGRGVIVHMLLIGWASTVGTACSPPIRSSARWSSRRASAWHGSRPAWPRPGGSCGDATSSRRPAPRRTGVAVQGRGRGGRVIAALALGPTSGPGRHRQPRRGLDRPRRSTTHAPAAGADRPLRAAERPTRRPAQLQQARRRRQPVPAIGLCNVYVYLPQPKSVPFQQTGRVRRQRQYNGCWKASSPPASSAARR